MGAGSEGGNVVFGVELSVDVVDVVVDVVGREKVGGMSFAVRGFELRDYRRKSLFGLIV